MSAQRAFTEALTESDHSIANLMRDVMNQIEKLGENNDELLAQRIQNGITARNNFSQGKWHETIDFPGANSLIT